VWVFHRRPNICLRHSHAYEKVTTPESCGVALKKNISQRICGAETCSSKQFYITYRTLSPFIKNQEPLCMPSMSAKNNENSDLCVAALIKDVPRRICVEEKSASKQVYVACTSKLPLVWISQRSSKRATRPMNVGESKHLSKD
jgi:hypothetical protein